MICSKCGGLVIDDCGDVRCLNCGRRNTDPARASELEPPAPRLRSVDDVMALAMRDVRVTRETEEEPEMGATWTPERRAKFEATIAAKKAARGEEPDASDASPKKNKSRATSASVPAVRSEKVRVLPASSTDAVRGIDEMIAKLEDDLAALRRAKEMLANR